MMSCDETAGLTAVGISLCINVQARFYADWVHSMGPKRSPLSRVVVVFVVVVLVVVDVVDIDAQAARDSTANDPW